jgi:hypothetical protein
VNICGKCVWRTEMRNRHATRHEETEHDHGSRRERRTGDDRHRAPAWPPRRWTNDDLGRVELGIDDYGVA